MNRNPAVTAVLAAILGLGCAPDVSVQGAEVDAVGWEQVDGHVALSATNPWPLDITLVRYHYSLDVGTSQVARGDERRATSVPARESRSVRVPYAVSPEAILDSAVDWSRGAKAPFSLSGEVVFDTPIGEEDVPFSVGGEVPVLQEPTSKMPTVELKDWSLWSGTVDLAVHLGVHNPNPLTLRVFDVAYGVRFGSEELVEGEPGTVTLREGGVSDLTLPVRLDFYGVGRGIVEAVTTGVVSGSAEVRGDVDTPWDRIPLVLSKSGRLSLYD